MVIMGWETPATPTNNRMLSLIDYGDSPPNWNQNTQPMIKTHNVCYLHISFSFGIQYRDDLKAVDTIGNYSK